ncbi:hypothetical protein EDB80DRAFT_698958 [Ilyonectria destructans]|nr:hypothetical protein EDB80DRAFT_698958 [Ilyonectria destructans]
MKSSAFQVPFLLASSSIFFRALCRSSHMWYALACSLVSCLNHPFWRAGDRFETMPLLSSVAIVSRRGMCDPCRGTARTLLTRPRVRERTPNFMLSTRRGNGRENDGMNGDSE